jgi:misacylated tRNA(Ala) deacylase
MTELLYLGSIDAGYERAFRARITALPPGGVVLDRTLFYPVGGGQPADHGTLRSASGALWKVVDVTRSGGSALHRLERPRAGAPVPRVGEEVDGAIDWPRRHLHMRCHTAQHLLGARAYALTGLRTRKAVLGQGGGRIELEAAWPATVEWSAACADVRGRLDAHRPVRIHFLPRAEYDRSPADRSGLVPLAPQVDPVRLVEIESSDRSPCGGTHVRNTSEVGAIEFLDPRPLADGSSELAFRLSPVSAPSAPG